MHQDVRCEGIALIGGAKNGHKQFVQTPPLSLLQRVVFAGVMSVLQGDVLVFHHQFASLACGRSRANHAHPPKRQTPAGSSPKNRCLFPFSRSKPMTRIVSKSYLGANSSLLDKVEKTNRQPVVPAFCKLSRLCVDAIAKEIGVVRQ